MTSFEFENGGCNGRSGSGAAVLILPFSLQGSSSSALEGEWCSGWSPSQVIIPQPSQVDSQWRKRLKLSLTDPWRWRVGIILALLTFLPLVVPQGWSNIFSSVALNFQSYFHVFSRIILEVLSFLTYCALYISLRPNILGHWTQRIFATLTLVGIYSQRRDTSVTLVWH